MLNVCCMSCSRCISSTLMLNFCNVFGDMLGTVYRAVLAAGAAVSHHKVGEPTLYVSGGRCVDEGIAVVKKYRHLAVVFQKIRLLVRQVL